jgi:hypothetical protein
VQRELLLEERETLLPSKSPGSSSTSHGTTRLVASYSIVECIEEFCRGGGITGEKQRVWDEFSVRGDAL